MRASASGARVGVFLAAAAAATFVACTPESPYSRVRPEEVQAKQDAPYDQFLKNVLTRTAGGRRLKQLYDVYLDQIEATVKGSAALAAAQQNVDIEWKPIVQALVDDRGSSQTITPQMMSDMMALADGIKRAGTGQVPNVIQIMQNVIGLANVSLPARADAGFDRVMQAAGTITVPVASSIHGVPPTFFHSDVTVFNVSPLNTINVTATYRCFTGSCGNATQSFALAPREMRSIPDIAAALFGAPESGGAIEFTSTDGIVVNSRVYTPTRPAPTYGMAVPGLPADEAYPTVALPGLSFSSNPSVGFRTNVGVYNGNDVALNVDFALYDARGASLGHSAKSVGARQAFQINDVFRSTGLARELGKTAVQDVPDGYCIVTGDGVHPLFAYASVVDNQSQDLTFIKGENGAPNGPVNLTLPVVASIHGVAPSFFHSDVRILNTSPVTASAVHAVYRCFGGACGASDQILPVQPGQELVLDDVVQTLFGAPETGGAVEFTGGAGIVITSRLYTPSKPGPTVGQGVPALTPLDATTFAVITSLSGSPSAGSGFRTNVGLFNPGTAFIPASLSVYNARGQLLGTAAQGLAAHQAVQLNDVFRVVGATGDLTDAYCIITGDGTNVFFSYGSVVDNQSQDPILIKGRSLLTP